MDAFKLIVKTGGQEHAGTDANVLVKIADDRRVRAPSLKLDLPLHDDLERGTLDIYTQPIPKSFGKPKRLYIVRDSKGRSDDWFCDYVIVQDPRGSQSERTFRKIRNIRHPGIISDSNGEFAAEVYFPVCRWIRANHEYVFDLFATCLPTEDDTAQVRQDDLDEKRKRYTYVVNIERGPAQFASL